jgi:hypothetical protein
MPARQDQTLQIFLIVFIFLFLVSAVVAYLGWRGYSEQQQRATGLETQNNDLNTQVRNYQVELEDMREMTGFGRGDNTADVKKAAKEELKTVQGREVNYSAGIPYEPVSQWASEGETEEHIPPYRVVLQTVHKELQEAVKREAALKVDVAELEKANKALEETSAAMVKKAEDARKQVEADAAAARNGYDEDRARMAQTEKQLMAKVESQKTEFESKLAKYEADKQAMTKEVDKLEHAVQNLITQRKDEPGSFEIADGRISWVNQNGTVWINLGTADSLRRQVTFSVYDSDQHDAAKATKKGSIEVTRLLGEHMAEAKITEDDATNPILTGDQIYSQVWHRGKQLHFALTGFIDFDDDGKSDMQLARELIEMNGGVVDAYLDDQGKVQGDITANTRYLVLGDIPESAIQVNLQAGYHSMSQLSSQLGVESITLPQFLAQMGYRPKDRMVQLGTGATAQDFPPRREGDVPRITQPRFRARTPYRAPAETVDSVQ